MNALNELNEELVSEITSLLFNQKQFRYGPLENRSDKFLTKFMFDYFYKNGWQKPPEEFVTTVLQQFKFKMSKNRTNRK